MQIRLAALIAVSLFAFADTKPDPWRPDQVVQTADLANKFPSGDLPMIVMVGPRILYNGNHIKGASFAGPAGKDAGLALLKTQMASVPKDAKIVIYCGCCPMDHCPNIRPAFTALRDAGFTNVKIVDLPTNLQSNWTANGYPVEKGDIPK